jgi:hypothetical protein
MGQTMQCEQCCDQKCRYMNNSSRCAVGLSMNLSAGYSDG